MTYTAQCIAAAAERIMIEASDPAEVWHRIQSEIPGVEAEDVMIAGRLRQARLHLAAGEWAQAAGCAVLLATDLTGRSGIVPRDAWAFLRRLDHPMVAEFVRLFDGSPDGRGDCFA